jgi:predicted ATPase/class 3 adenylate cyclase
MARTAPTGIITLLLLDIQDSTPLWEKMGDRFRPVLDRHDQIARARIERWEGFEVKNRGDGFMVAFKRATDAIQCALDLQQAFAAEPWPAEVGELKVRIGIHTGEALLIQDPLGRVDYFGPMVNRAARITDAAHGGQTVASAATCDLLQGARTREFELIDLGRHRLRGVEQAEHLFEVRHPDLPTRQFPPLRTLNLLRTNLPTHPTPFVGRSEELAALRALLGRPETRLLTITGPGGCGKTRLAHQIASDCGQRCADGIWAVNLADIHEPDNVAPQIAAALQIAPLPNADPRDQLLQYLRERDLLLVLDSFEHVIGASLLLADMLRSAPRVVLLVTSQIALRLRGEQVYQVPPMQTPDSRLADPQSLLRIDSVALFVAHAGAVRSEFALTAGNARVIAEICRKLDGLPLAIELAAAQMVEMSPAEVLEGLQSRLDLLWTESPDLPERHRTLSATLDWSYGLLADAEQRALRQLSVFAGGCFRESVHAVCGPEGLAALRLLGRHSLLNSDETLSGRTRYRLLQTVQEYAREKLHAQPEVARAVGERHARHYLELAEQRAALVRTRDEARALEELAEELDNLRAAMEWAGASQQPELLSRLALALHEPLYRLGFWEEARWRLQIGRDAAETIGSDARPLLAAMHHRLASLGQDRGDLAAAREQAEASLALWRELQGPTGTAEALNLLGLLSRDEGDADAAQRCFEEALGLLAGPDAARRGMVLNNLALLASHRGDPEEAGRLYQESLSCQRQAGDLRHEATTLGNLGVLAHNAGDLAEARRFYQESLARHRTMGDRHGIAVMLNNLGELAEMEADLEGALTLFLHAERMLRDLQAAVASVPAESLARLAGQIGAERWAELSAAAESMTWEEIVEPGRRSQTPSSP